MVLVLAYSILHLDLDYFTLLFTPLWHQCHWLVAKTTQQEFYQPCWREHPLVLDLLHQVLRVLRQDLRARPYLCHVQVPQLDHQKVLPFLGLFL